METRLIVAYLLIAFLLLAGALALRHLHRKREAERRRLRGHRRSKPRPGAAPPS